MVIAEPEKSNGMKMPTLDELAGEDTLGRIYLSKVYVDPDKVFIFYKNHDEYNSISREEALIQMKALYTVFNELGLIKGDRILFLSENRWELEISILSAVFSGFVAVPVQPELTYKQINEVLINSKPKCIMISDENQLDKLEKIKGLENIPVITFDNVSSSLINYQDIIRKYKRKASYFISNLFDVRLDNLAYIMYSSSEEGNLVGSKLTHENILSSVRQFADEVGEITREDVILSCLPANPDYNAIAELYSAVYSGGTYVITEFYNIDSLIEDIKNSEATVLFGNQVIWKSLYKKFYSQDKEDSGEIFNNLTGGKLKIGFSNSTNLDSSITEFFANMNLKIYQCLGFAQTSGIIAIKSAKDNKKWKVLKDTKININIDGEILVKGKILSTGYFNLGMPNLSYSNNDVFKTGNIGVLDKERFFKIIDRKDDFIILSNGCKISPQKIENMVKSNFISQIAIVGDNKDFLSALIVPDFEFLRKYARKELKIIRASNSELIENKWIRALYKLILANLNEELPKNEAVLGYTLLEKPFSVNSMELTSDGKPVRSVIQQKRKKEINAIYKNSFIKQINIY